MNQRMILSELDLHFKRDHQTQEAFLKQTVKIIQSELGLEQVLAGTKGFVLGLSGGLDSCLLALIVAGMPNTKLTLVSLPNGTQSDMPDVKECLEAIRAVNSDVEFIEFNIGTMMTMLETEMFHLCLDKTDLTVGNAAARCRMIAQYAVAKNQLVIGTDHATEAVVGYYTKHGDGGADLMPLGGLLKDDMYEMAKMLGAPECVLTKRPAAGLGITNCDEDELGMSYVNHIAPFLRGYVMDAEIEEKIVTKYGATAHKRRMPNTVFSSNQIAKPTVTHLIVDCVYDFIDGSLACNYATEAVNNIVKHINQNPEERVLYIREMHPANHCSFKANGGEWPAHAVFGTRGCEIHESFYREIKKTTNTPLEHFNVFAKGCNAEVEQYSGFEAMNYQYGALADNISQTVIVSGIATEYCVFNTIKDLKAQNFNVIVYEKLLGFVDEAAHKQTLQDLIAMGVQVIYN